MLETIRVDEYTRDVLPYSAEEWAGNRTPERYAADLSSFVASGYGRRRFRLLGVRVDGRVVTSCKRYERDLRCGDRTMRAIGIGAVFTWPAYRGRGLATAMLGSLLDAEQKSGTDFAFLFSDIRPAFYEELGFATLPSRIITLRADALAFQRIEPSPIADGDWPAVARCFASLEATRPFALRRTPLVWEFVHHRHRMNPTESSAVNLAVRGPRGAVLAYCVGRRIVRGDTYAVDEFAYVPGSERLVGPLLRAAAGDLRKITGWLPPRPARDALPRGSVRPRRDAVLMIAPLSKAARTQWRAQAEKIRTDAGDVLWSTDHI